MQPGDYASHLSRLQEENAQLRSQVEQQCKHMIEMAETIQSKLPCLLDASVEAQTENGNHRDPKRGGYDAAASFMVRHFHMSVHMFAPPINQVTAGSTLSSCCSGDTQPGKHARTTQTRWWPCMI